jgi:hypothetical protein
MVSMGPVVTSATNVVDEGALIKNLAYAALQYLVDYTLLHIYNEGLK